MLEQLAFHHHAVDQTGKQRQIARAGGEKLDRAHHEEARHNPEREAEIANPIDHERLDRGVIGAAFVIPKADQQIGRDAHPFPADKHLQEVVGGHQRQHGEGEEAQIAEEARAVRVFGHITPAIEVHEE